MSNQHTPLSNTSSDMGIDIFGLNCSTGPIEMEPSIQWILSLNDVSKT